MQSPEKATVETEKTAGIYIHVPFCKQACVYCNFHFSTSLKHKNELLTATIKELELQRDYLCGAMIETIYLGGGTPSLLSADEINWLFETILKYYPVKNIKEFTLEANPDDLDKNYIKSLKSTPVSRFSIGVQSFRDEDLAYMKRAHNAREAEYAIKAAQDAGFDNLTIDLIYGTPGLTDAMWKVNLVKMGEFGIPHFSAYALTVEEKTALHHAIQHKRVVPVDPEQAAGQFELLMEQAAVMGYEHYEISNFAAQGKYAIHNTHYWQGIPYLGVGPSAHSFDGATRRWNVANNAVYAKSILTENKINYDEEKLTDAQRLNEYIMTSLRTMWGCDLEKIEQEWGSAVANDIERRSYRYMEQNQVAMNERKLTLTSKGKLFADKIAGELFWEV